MKLTFRYNNDQVLSINSDSISLSYIEEYTKNDDAIGFGYDRGHAAMGIINYNPKALLYDYIKNTPSEIKLEFDDQILYFDINSFIRYRISLNNNMFREILFIPQASMRKE